MRLTRVISNLSPEVIPIGPYNLAMVNNSTMVSKVHNLSINGIVVTKPELISEVLADEKLYLKPLFCTEQTEGLGDGIYTASNASAIENKITYLTNKIEPYTQTSLPEQDEQRLLAKICRYLASRGSSLEPRNSRYSKIGYHYPLVEALSIEHDPIFILKNLDKFYWDNYFKREIIDKVNICYECSSSYLNFSECCSKCSSIDLKSEELVHHFRCAYVGPQSDYEKNEKLVCPKCNHQLKHIGIDYDKPSENSYMSIL